MITANDTGAQCKVHDSVKLCGDHPVEMCVHVHTDILLFVIDFCVFTTQMQCVQEYQEKGTVLCDRVYICVLSYNSNSP